MTHAQPNRPNSGNAEAGEKKSRLSLGERWGTTPPRRGRKGRRDGAGSARGSWATEPRPAEREPEQLTLDQVRAWGGRRAGAGRKAGPRPRVAHVARPAHARWRPVHVTLRRAKGLPSLRTGRLHDEVRAAIRQTRRDDFRIAHYSIQADHVHLIVEAEDAAALTRGMRSFAVRAAMGINGRVLRRPRGRIWGDRYHRRDLGSPRQVRNTLVYVMANHLKHGETDVGLLDPCSSGPWWDGWIHVLEPPPEPCPVAQPTTWLLTGGWQRLGLLHLGEVPRALRS
jgi:REP element-mobilizing transposase RayT